MSDTRFRFAADTMFESVLQRLLCGSVEGTVLTEEVASSVAVAVEGSTLLPRARRADDRVTAREAIVIN